MKKNKMIYIRTFPDGMLDSPTEGTKLSLQDVERVLTAHNQGILKRSGQDWMDIPVAADFKGCIVQIVENEPDLMKACKKNLGVASWFDTNYNNKWTTEEFIQAMADADVF